MIRTFIAIELNDQVRQLIKDAQDRFKTHACDVKWVNPDNAHLTLKFIGNIEEDKIDSIAEVMEKTCQNHSALTIPLTGIGAFPKMEKPRVIWAGLDDKERKIKDLAKELENKLQKIGVKKEGRSFQSHITIGRVRSLKNIKPLTEEMKFFTLAPNITQDVNAITLFKSTLTPKGPIYEKLKEQNLRP